MTPLVGKGPLQVKSSDSGMCPSNMSRGKGKAKALCNSVHCTGCIVLSDTTSEKEIILSCKTVSRKITMIIILSYKKASILKSFIV